MFIAYFILGLVFGSFISLVSYRIPKSKNIFITRSQCVKCSHKLTVKDLIPVLSWLLSKGKCNYCKSKISIRYPLIEIFTGFIFSLIIIIFGINNFSIIILALVILLITISVIDFENYIIPDSLQLVFLIIAFYWSWLFHYNILTILINFIIGFLSAFFIMVIFKYIRKKDGLGFGDVKFIAIATIFFGYENLIIFYFFSGLIGVANGLLWLYLFRRSLYPFAPSLCISFFLCLIIPYFFDKSWYIGINLLEMIISNFLF